MTKTALTITRPDDWHIHLRDGSALETTVPHVAARFARAIVMPNLAPPVIDCAQAQAYRRRILAHVPEGMRFEPLMTLYLTDRTSPDEILRAAGEGAISAVKLYPAGATTNSESGVTAIDRVTPVLEAMQAHDVPLLVHGEVTGTAVDIFDRELRFIERVLEPLLRDFPSLRVVFEHITTRAAVDYVSAAPATIAATITAHHLLFNRNALLAGGVRPHLYCLPVLKREEDRLALLRAATGGNTKFFLGTDSAPHERARKETACGCAGIYTAHAAIELYADIFEQAGALESLEGFASHHGADFYRLPRNTDRITLEQRTWTVPDRYPFGDGALVPLYAGRQIRWRIKS